MYHNRIVIQGEKQIQIADQSDALPTGTYGIWSDTDIFIKVGKIVDDVDETNGYPVFAGTVVHVAVQEGEKIGVTAAASIMKIGM